MSKEKKKPDLVVWDEKKGYYQRELTYGSNIGAPSIKLDDVGGWKKNQANTVNKHFTKKYDEIKSEYERLLEEVKYNDLVYSAEYNFIPVIGETYHLYKRTNGTIFLSLIEPTSWNQEYISSFILDSRQKWVKI
jgi:hypothetical protein